MPKKRCSYLSGVAPCFLVIKQRKILSATHHFCQDQKWVNRSAHVTSKLYILGVKPITTGSCKSVSATANTGGITCASATWMANAGVAQRPMLSDSSVLFAVLGKFEFESFKGVHIHFHVCSPSLMLTLNDVVPLNAITGNLSTRESWLGASDKDSVSIQNRVGTMAFRDVQMTQHFISLQCRQSVLCVFLVELINSGNTFYLELASG